jgi:hypothetical protein
MSQKVAIVTGRYEMDFILLQQCVRHTEQEDQRRYQTLQNENLKRTNMVTKHSDRAL